jgi:hypothetical protein
MHLSLHCGICGKVAIREWRKPGLIVVYGEALFQMLSGVGSSPRNGARFQAIFEIVSGCGDTPARAMLF